MSELKALVERHFLDFKCDEKQYLGYIDGESQYDLFISEAKILGFSFSTTHSFKHKSSRILFTAKGKNADNNIPYCGSPFQIVRAAYMSCCHGGRYKGRSLENMLDDSPFKKRRKMQPTKKIGCLATMAVKCLKVFNADCYKINGPYKRNCADNRKILKKLNEELLTTSPPSSQLRFMVVMSSEEAHNHTVVPTSLQQMLHSPKPSLPVKKIELPRRYGRIINMPFADCSSSDISYDDILEVDINSPYISDTNISEDEESEGEVIDVKRLWEEGREKLKVILGCTYLKHAPEDVSTIVKLIRTVEDAALSSARKSNVGLLATRPKVQRKSKKTIIVKSKNIIYPQYVTQRSSPKCIVQRSYVTNEWPNNAKQNIDAHRQVLQQCDGNHVVNTIL